MASVRDRLMEESNRLVGTWSRVGSFRKTQSNIFNENQIRDSFCTSFRYYAIRIKIARRNRYLIAMITFLVARIRYEGVTRYRLAPWRTRKGGIAANFYERRVDRVSVKFRRYRTLFVTRFKI